MRGPFRSPLSWLLVAGLSVGVRPGSSWADAQVEALRPLLLEGQTPVFSLELIRDSEGIESLAKTSPIIERLQSPAAFGALVEDSPADRAALAEVFQGPHKADSLRLVQRAVYAGLARVVNSDMPSEQRQSLAEGLAESSARFFDGLNADASLPRYVREQADATQRRLRDPDALIGGLSRQREVRRQWDALDSAYKAVVPAVPPRPSGGAGRWVTRLLRRGPKNAPPPKNSSEVRLSDIEAAVSHARSRLEPLLEKSRISWRDRGELWLIGEKVEYLGSTIDRFRDVTIRSWFEQRKNHRILHVPDQDGLRLERTRDGFLVKARFATRIADPKFLSYFKTSIEEYWRGTFDYHGRRYRLATEVSIERLDQAQPFPDGALHLIEAKEGDSRAGAGRIVFNVRKNGSRYFAAPHEFGHVLGLNDEYWERFDIQNLSQRVSYVPGSLMSSDFGIVRPDHLRLVYQLLRRHSLEPNDDAQAAQARSR